MALGAPATPEHFHLRVDADDATIAYHGTHPTSEGGWATFGKLAFLEAL